MTEGFLQNWEKWPLAEVGEWLGGGTPSSTNADFWNGHIPWVSPKDMKANEITTSQDNITQAALDNSAAKLIPAHSVLFVTRSGILSHSFPVAINQVAVTVNQDLKAITPVEVIEPQYLTWLLRSYERQILSTCSKHGTTVHSIEMPALKSLKVPIPPILEQRRIVAKIEELFSELDKGIEALSTAREQLNAYRVSILKSAFDGRLTEDWRRENSSRFKSADQIRSQLEQASLVRYSQALKDWKTTGRATRPSKPRPPEPIESVIENNAEPSPLPKGWNWVPLSWLLSTTKKPMTTGPFGTMLKKQEHKTSGVPVLGIENIGKAVFVPGNKIFVSKEKSEELTAFAVEAGDVIISRSGTVGEICEVPAGLGPALISTNLIRVTLNASVIIPAFFVFMFQGGGSVRTQVKDLCKGSSRDFLNQSILGAIKFPLCSLDEQVEILKVLSSQMSYVEKLAESIEVELNRVQSLRQSILKQAFSGQLVAQDPTDEPASVLLERIRAERNKADAEKTGRKTKKTGNGKTGKRVIA